MNEATINSLLESIEHYLHKEQAAGILSEIRADEDKWEYYYEDKIGNLGEAVLALESLRGAASTDNKATAFLHYELHDGDAYVLSRSKNDEITYYKVGKGKPYSAEFQTAFFQKFLNESPGSPPLLDLKFRPLTLAEVRVKHRIPANYFIRADLPDGSLPKFVMSEFLEEERRIGRAKPTKKNLEILRRFTSSAQYAEICERLKGVNRSVFEQAILRLRGVVDSIPRLGMLGNQGLEAVAYLRYTKKEITYYVLNYSRIDDGGRIVSIYGDSADYEFLYRGDFVIGSRLDLDWVPTKLKNIKGLPELPILPRKRVA